MHLFIWFRIVIKGYTLRFDVVEHVLMSVHLRKLPILSVILARVLLYSS